MPIELNAILARLSEGQRNALQGRNLVLTQGTRLHEAGSQIEFAYFPRGCVVSDVVVMGDGRFVGTAAVGREGAIGLTSDFSPGASPTMNLSRAEVLIGGAALCAPIAHVAALVQMSGEFAASVSNYVRTLLREANQTAACNALHSLEQRVSRYLLTVDQRSGGQPIPVTQETLAQILGAHRASLNKVVQRLQFTGAIAPLRRGHIDIGDRSILKSLSCACASGPE